MLHTDYRITKFLIDIRVEQAQRWAEAQRLRREVGQAEQGGASRHVRHLIWQLGCSLVEMGERLQQHNQPQPPPLQGEMRGLG